MTVISCCCFVSFFAFLTTLSLHLLSYNLASSDHAPNFSALPLLSALAWGFEEGSILAMCVCTYVRVLSRSGMSICTHLHHMHAQEPMRHMHWQRSRTGPREEQRFLTMEDVEDSATHPPQRMCFAESSAECSWRLATLRKRKQQNLWTKKRKQQEENERKCKRKKHVVESLHKPDINYAHFHFRFNHSPWARCVRNVHICTRTVQREASCTCILLVIRMFLLARSYFILAFLALS